MYSVELAKNLIPSPNLAFAVTHEMTELHGK